MTPADSNTEYAYWTASETAFKVTYSLSVVHEIDFQVNEGFRRIPHGGIETGGLLFGTSASKSATVEAFRAIECEHASGPSFNLSEHDVARLREQLAATASDPELTGLEVLGWFVAHTRSPLQMNEREQVLFEELFPGPGRLMLLVKPERFQPTRFAFIVRNEDGGVNSDGSSNAIILPLPGRAGRSTEGPAASIPAPVQRAAPAAAAVSDKPEHTLESKPETPAANSPAPATPIPSRPAPVPSEAAAPSFWRDVPAGPQREEPILRIQEPPPASHPVETKALTVLPPSTPPETLPPIDEIRRRRSEKAEPADLPERRGRQRITRRMSPGERRSSVQLALLLLLAAGLGCGLGYLAYLQLPSPTIPLSLRRQGANLWVSWPAEQTSDALSAEIRVDDGEPKPLSLQQREAGKALVAVRTDNLKIELIAQHRLRDSRGIVRYVRPNGTTP